MNREASTDQLALRVLSRTFMVNELSFGISLAMIGRLGQRTSALNTQNLYQFIYRYMKQLCNNALQNICHVFRLSMFFEYFMPIPYLEIKFTQSYV